MVALEEIPKSYDRYYSQSEQTVYSQCEQTVYSIPEVLKKMGLTPNESKVYLYLNQNGSKKAREIAVNQKIVRTEIYHLLVTLQNKGMVTAGNGRGKKFEAIGFETAFEMLINNALKKIEELHLMKGQLCEKWSPNLYR